VPLLRELWNFRAQSNHWKFAQTTRAISRLRHGDKVNDTRQVAVESHPGNVESHPD